MGLTTAAVPAPNISIKRPSDWADITCEKYQNFNLSRNTVEIQILWTMGVSERRCGTRCLFWQGVPSVLGWVSRLAPTETGLLFKCNLGLLSTPMFTKVLLADQSLYNSPFVSGWYWCKHYQQNNHAFLLNISNIQQMVALFGLKKIRQLSCRTDIVNFTCGFLL